MSLKRISTWFKNGENVLFVILIIVYLVPIWAFRYFPSQDGPSHINNANVIREYYHPAYTIFRQYYILNKSFVPNIFSHFLMATLMSIMPILAAEKILLSIYIILLPISVRYALRAVRPDSRFLAILAFPLIYNFLFHMGFYNFSFSLPLFFFVVGYWIKHQEKFAFRETIILSILSLLLYSCHIFSLVMAYIVITILAIWFIFIEIKSRPFFESFRMRALLPLCAFLPTIFFVLYFFGKTDILFTPSLPIPILWEKLYNFYSLISYEAVEMQLSTAFAGLFAAIFAYLVITKIIRRQLNRWDGLLFVIAAYIIIYFTAPEPKIVRNGMLWGQMLNDRISLFPFFALIIWFGAQSYHKIIKRTIKSIAVGIGIILISLYAFKYAELNDYIEEYLLGMHLVESNKTILPLCFSREGRKSDGETLSVKIEPFLHLSGHIAAQRRVVDLDNYEAARGYFPTIFHPGLNPFIHIGINGGLEEIPPRVEFLTYSERTRGSVDYVLIWQMHEEQYDDKFTKSIFDQLEEGYDLIHVSPKRGFAQLYRRKNWEN